MTTPLQLRFANHSQVPADTPIWIGLVPGSQAAMQVHDAATGAALLPVNQGGSYPRAGNWYALSGLSQGLSIEAFSGRVYVCYGMPWTVQGAGYEPAQTPADPNFLLRYDKLELTYTGSASDVANLTSIDYWAIPMSLQATRDGAATGAPVLGLLGGITAQQMADALSALTTPPVSGLAGAVPARVPTDPGAGQGFARVIGPSSYPPVFPPPGGRPLTPFNLLQGYLQTLLARFGPGTARGASLPMLGGGVVALLGGQFAGVGPNVPPTGPQAQQAYALYACIDADCNLTLRGQASAVGDIQMHYACQDLLNPHGMHGGDAPFSLNGGPLAAPGNDVYGWIAGDLFAGLNIGAVGSPVKPAGAAMPVGAWRSEDWFKLPVSQFFAGLQPHSPVLAWNAWAATLAARSQAYNFAYTDRFAPVFVSLNPAMVNGLLVTLEPATVA